MKRHYPLHSALLYSTFLMSLSKRLSISILGDVLALLSGALLTLAFAPFSFYVVAILSPALLLFLWLNVSTYRAFLRGLLYGLGLFGTGVSWVFISIHTYGEASILLSSVITFGFVLILALFPAINGYLLTRYFTKNNSMKQICAFPALWVLLEWFRSWIFTGFPWLFLGYTQINSVLSGYAPLFSVYGVSLAVLLTSALLVNIFYKRKYLLRNAIIIALIWLIGWGLSHISWTKPIGQPMKITLIQGNIPQNLKWTWESLTPTLQRYQQMTEQHWDSQIIIWPEAAVPIPLHDALDYLRTLHLEATKHHTALITGIPVEDKTKNGYYNAILTIGKGFGFYFKKHLVPFGEYTPMPQLLTHYLDQFHIPLPNTISDNKLSAPLLANGMNIAPFICYEIAFPELVWTKNNTINMLLTVSNDAWFGHSIALAQHLEIAQMRSLEMGRPSAFVSNTGITAFILPNGKIQSHAPVDQPYALTDTIQKMTGKTPWQRMGLDPLLMLVVILLTAAGINEKKQRKK
jgi:apolipoprotein N-acyltransferase